MNKKIFENARFCPKGDIEANWNKAVGFVPLKKEIIEYLPDENYPTVRFKVGDGVTTVQDLPFASADDKEIKAYVDSKIAEIPQADYEQNDAAAADYIKNRPFYDSRENFSITITDSNIENYYVFDGVVAHVSDDYPPIEEIINNDIVLQLRDGTEFKPYLADITSNEATDDPNQQAYFLSTQDYGPVGMIVISINEEFWNNLVGVVPEKTGIYLMSEILEAVPITLSIGEPKGELKQLDEKYIPDSIARVEDIENKFVKLEGYDQIIKGSIHIVHSNNENFYVDINSYGISANDDDMGQYCEVRSDGIYCYISYDNYDQQINYRADGIAVNGVHYDFPYNGWEGQYTLATTADIKPPMAYVTWAELKELRDSSQLVPGRFYRITDYQCTTIQENTRAMDHQFDIIVQALSENELSENASADYHEGDTYFSKTTPSGIIDSNIISEQTETILEDGQVEWVYSIYEDYDGQNGYDDMIPRKSDAFVAFDFLENNNGIIVPVLYKNDTSTDENGEPIYGIDDIDYQDQFFYVGEETIDGVVYDKWRKIEDSENTSFAWDSVSKQYALTNKIVGEGLLIEATFTYQGITREKIANLNAWQLKYCLDNDTNRFAWADNISQFIVNLNSRFSEGALLTRQPSMDTFLGDSELVDYFYAWGTQADANDGDSANLIYSKTENLVTGDIVWNAWDNTFETVIVITGGKGVIYYMKDEWNNEVPYDFKNIIFIDYYTFNGYDSIDDASLSSGLIRDNTIGVCYNENGNQILNNIVFNPDDPGSVLKNIQIYNNCSNIRIDYGDYIDNIIIYSGISNKYIGIYSSNKVYKPSGFTEIILDEEE